jgi:acetamidase/formamidase
MTGTERTTARPPVVTATHIDFDRALPPVLTVPSGTVVTFECPGAPMPPDATVSDLDRIDFSHPHTIVGPVAVEGARAGDALVIDILEVELTDDYGHCLFVPGVGLLPTEFDEPYVQNFRFEDGYTTLGPGVRLPLEPFCGILGVAPAEQGPLSTIPPRRVGGNLDVRDLVAGSQLVLPVEVDGALFSCGDGHGLQGDGEVCVTALETAVRATLRLSLLEQAGLEGPRFTAPARRRPTGGRRARYGIAATGEDLFTASQDAVRAMIDHLVDTRALTREEAYVLCSLAVDLHVSQIVNHPRWTVSAVVPLDIFV